MPTTSGIKIAILKETAASENRVAISLDTLKKYISQGIEVSVQSGAGNTAALTDAALKDAGATIAKSVADTLKNADIIVSVQAPENTTLKSLKSGSLVISSFDPHKNEDKIKTCVNSKLCAMAMNFMPRITRAQSMDVLSSQSNLSGYKAVLDACEHYPRALPMMMTAAGTIPPAKIFVMGAGVAGLQAIATARRLGAVVTATDVRPATKEQVESLGASFVAVEDDEFKEAETAGGYAKEMSAAYKKKQAALVAEHIAKQDIVITTALIPGRPAPKLITEAMVKSMKAGSVIVDLAAETGGNCEATKPDSITNAHGVTIIGHTNTPSRLAADASALYAKNIMNFINLIYDAETKSMNIDWKDEIVQGITLTKDGKIVHPNLTTKPKATAKKAALKKPTTKKTAKKPAAKKAPTKKSATKKRVKP